MLFILFFAGIWAGAQNALAGGGSFVTLPALILTGLDARAANVASTIALFPGQILTGLSGRSLVSGTANVSFRTLLTVSLAGGALGGLLLLATPVSFFAHLVPWLVLFATAMFAWGSFGPRAMAAARDLGVGTTCFLQFLIAIYGGYFGGGIGFLMLAALTIAGMAVRNAAATKNMLAGVMNASAVAIFLFSDDLPWLRILVLAAGAILGGQLGVWALRRVNERYLRLGIVALGVALTIGLFFGSA